MRNKIPARLVFTLLLTTTLIALPAVADEPADEHPFGHFEAFREIDFGALDCDSLESGEHGMAVKRIQRGFLGVELTRLTPDLRRHFGVPADEGVMVGKVVDDSAAFRAGLDVGDIVTRVAGETVRDSSDLSSAIRRRGGETVDLEVWRDGSVRTLTATVEQKETCTFDLGALGIDFEKLGDFQAIQVDALKISEEAMERVRESLEAVDWQEHMERIHEVQGEHFGQRMEELQRRMEELQQRMEVEYGRYGEEIERAMEAKERALEERRRQMEKRTEHLSEAERAAHEKQMRAEIERAHAEARAAMAERRAAMEEERRAVEAEAAAAAEAAEAAAAEAEGGGTI